MAEPGHGQHRAEPAPLRAGVDADDVHLAHPAVVHFGPVEADEPAPIAGRNRVVASASVVLLSGLLGLLGLFGEEEAGRVEPRLPFADEQVVDGPAALL